MTPSVGIDPALMTQLINGMKRASHTLPDVGRQVEQTLTTLGVPLWGPGHLSSIGRQMNDRIPSLQGRLDLILATPDRRSGTGGGVLWADESGWLSKSPAEGMASATTLAAEIRTKITSRSLDAQTVAELERHRNDPFFAVAFLTMIPPRELTSLISRAYSADLPPSSRPLLYDTAIQDRFLTMLSTLLGTASHGVGRTRLAADYADRLIEDIDHPQNAYAVKRLLQDGDFDHAFLLALVRKLHDKDLAHPPDLTLPRDPWTLPGPRDVSPGDLSPLGTALIALAHHPAVAQDFFTDPARKPLAYLMRDHPWLGGADTDLGWAIQAATTEFRDHDLPPGGSRGYKSALIASWALRFWSAPKTQTNLPTTRPHLAAILTQYISDVHRSTQLFGKEVPGVMANLDPDKDLSGREPYGARFNADETKRAMTWLFEDDDAFRTVSAAHGLYAARMLDELAAKIAAEVERDFTAWRESHPAATWKQLDKMRQDILEEHMVRSGGAEFAAAVGDLGMTTWVIADAANISSIEKAKADDVRTRTFKQLTEQVVGLVPTPPGKFIGLVVDTAESLVFDKVTPSHEEQARQDADTALGAAKHMFTDLTASVMMRHGLFGEVSAQTHPYYYEDFAPGATGHFLTDKGIRPWAEMSADQRSAYEEWLSLHTTGRVFNRPDDALALSFKEAEKHYVGRTS
ncbi:hypothetical protein DMB42_15685 [Nonomuraea sp. WAC 01424]|uniref:hypothetical protein n=1 Tax=Nonomuraea sp. WAC 01424 TaxID=2203200 RepID=UPI000F7A7831|nr:hypothetical protein [Nonomuraea sp. WAC 01424]RSN10365.1 hypothetical protein DMB42_15685 [Nonomuraea sp. WAC 01424]